MDRAEKTFFPLGDFFPSLKRKRERVPHRFKRMSCSRDCLIIEEQKADAANRKVMKYCLPLNLGQKHMFGKNWQKIVNGNKFLIIS